MAYRKFDGDPLKDVQFIEDTIGAANRGLIPSSAAIFAEHFGIELQDWLDVVVGMQGNDQQLLAYAKDLRPQYKVGLLSNVGKGRLQSLLSPEELGVFDAAISSGDIGYAKPEAQAYEIMADRLGVRLNECVMIDDREDYCMGARGVGMQAVRYESFEQMKHELEGMLHGDKVL